MGRDRKNSAPEISPMGHIVRVASAHHDHCNYISLLVHTSLFNNVLVARKFCGIFFYGSIYRSLTNML